MVSSIEEEKWLNKAICEGQKVVDLTGCYSNLSVWTSLSRLFLSNTALSTFSVTLLLLFNIPAWKHQNGGMAIKGASENFCPLYS